MKLRRLARTRITQHAPSHILAIRNLRIRDGRTLSNLDPFDRLLIAQAKTEECVLLSQDRNFENYLEGSGLPPPAGTP